MLKNQLVSVFIMIFAFNCFAESSTCSTNVIQVNKCSCYLKTPVQRWCSAPVRTQLKAQAKEGDAEAACRLYWHYLTYMDFFLAADWAQVAICLGCEDDALNSHVRMCEQGVFVAFSQEGDRTRYLPRENAIQAGWLDSNGQPIRQQDGTVFFYKFVGVNCFLEEALQREEVDGPAEKRYYEHLLIGEQKYNKALKSIEK